MIEPDDSGSSPHDAVVAYGTSRPEPLPRWSYTSEWMRSSTTCGMLLVWRTVPLHAMNTNGIFELVIGMTRNTSVVLYLVVMIAVVVGVDLLFFKNRFWERLIVNIGIVLVFAAFYLRFLKNL